DRVSGLETDDAAPAALGELRPGLRRILRQLREGRLRTLEDGHPTGQVQRLLLVEPCDAGMRLVGRAKRLLCLALPVVLVRPLARSVDQRAAVRCDQLRIRGDAHARTAAGIRPRSSRCCRISCALSSGSCCSVSIRTSGSAGSSYGSSTPVKPLISPLNAFL